MIFLKIKIYCILIWVRECMPSDKPQNIRSKMWKTITYLYKIQ